MTTGKRERMESMISTRPRSNDTTTVYVLSHLQALVEGLEDQDYSIVAVSQQESEIKKRLIWEVLTHYHMYEDSTWTVLSITGESWTTQRGVEVFHDWIDEMYGACLKENWQDLRVDLLLLMTQMCERDYLCTRFYDLLVAFDGFSQLDCNLITDYESMRLQNVSRSRWMQDQRNRYVEAILDFVKRERASIPTKIQFLQKNAPHLLPTVLW